jgi:hypothetical protein
VSISDDYRAVVATLRGWGYTATEWPGCYGRGNGLSWADGRPIGHLNHHYVCSLNPSAEYIDQLVDNLAAGEVVNWFADVNGAAYLIGTGPMNHSGTGMSSVRDRTRKGQAPTGAATSAGDISGNSWYSGTECQHPGDSTPWPAPLLDIMVAINAAEFLQWGYTSARAINHFEWTNRKIDMSAGGGASSNGWAGAELRRRVAARMTDQEEDDMPLNDTDKAWIVDAINDGLRKALTLDETVNTTDVAATPNAQDYTVTGALERLVRLVALDATDQVVKFHPA